MWDVSAFDSYDVLSNYKSNLTGGTVSRAGPRNYVLHHTDINVSLVC